MRSPSLTLLIVAAFASTLGCTPNVSSPSSARAARAPTRTNPPTAAVAPVPEPEVRAPAASPSATPLVYEELVTGGASAEDALPLVIGIHGLGDSPAGVRAIASRFEGRARFVLPQAPTPYGPGFAWFPYYGGRGTPQQYAEGVSSAATLVAATIRQVRASRPSLGKTIVTGFSQGGMISYALAVQHADIVDAAIPMAGYLPLPLLPQAGLRLPPIRALHGDADDIVPLASDERTVAALRALGADASLHSYPGVRHAMSEAMRVDLSAAIAEALAH